MSLTSLIKIYNSKFSEDFCDEVIKLFKKENGKHAGCFGKGEVNTTVKNTQDYKIPSVKGDFHDGQNTPNIEKWIDIDNHIHDVLSPTINSYILEINSTLDGSLHGNLYLPGRDYNDTGHQIQEYIKNEGHYQRYHNDFSIINGTGYYRILTYIIYLNTIDEGGETVFFDDYKIKPTVGNIVIFPSTWTYPHCGNMPLSDNKYIITGWLYTSHTDP